MAETIIIATVISYLMTIPVFYFVLNERIETLEKITLSKNPRKRIGLVRTKAALKKDRLTAFLWPVVLIRGRINASAKKK